MKMKRLHLMLLLLIVQLASFAGPRNFQQAKDIALRQAARLGISMDEDSSAKAKSKRVKGVQGEVPAYYVFSNGEDKGFTVVSGDDRLPEVVGYSDKGTYDEANLPTNYVGFMRAYEELVAQMTQDDGCAPAAIAEAKTLRSSNYRQPVVAPLLGGIKWNQTTPYNNMCPLYRKGSERSVTGCVATAMAQVMMYYQYPRSLQADILQYVTKTYNLSMRRINKGETYDWDNMLDVYTADNYTEAQASAVAKLMYHCGAACEMDYGPSSGANVTPTRLAEYFGYDADLMQDLTRSFFTLAQWTQIMDRELLAKRPILYCGQSSDVGHEFVCDGSDGNGLYHINWGWGGSQDGYFDVAILNPEKGGAGSGNAPDGFNRYCGMIIGIAPDNGKVDAPLVDVSPVVMIGAGYSTMEITQATRSHANEAFTIETTSRLSNQLSESFSGSFAYGIMKEDGTYQPISPSNDIYIRGALSNGSTYYINKKVSFSYVFPIGRTVLYGLYSTDNKEWKKCDYAYLSPFVVEATATSLSLVATTLSADVVEVDGLLSDQENILNVTVSNQGDFEYLGLLSVYANSTNVKPENPIEQLYCTVPSQNSTTRSIKVAPSAGDLYVWVTDENGVDLVNCKRFVVTQSIAPKLVLVGKENNATLGEYELEKGYYYNNDIVKGPKVNDAKAVFTYYVRNDGGDYKANFVIRINSFGPTTIVSKNHEVEYRIATGETAKIQVEASPEDYANNHSFKSNIRLNDENASLDDSGMSSDELWIQPYDGSYYPLSKTEMYVYVTGVPTGISTIMVSGTSVRGGNGKIIICSDRAHSFKVYNLNGQIVNSVSVKAGENVTVPVSAGLYIVNGKKIIVK